MNLIPNQKCPVCDRQITKAATEQGTVLAPKYVRITRGGRLLFACGGCGSEVEHAPTGRLVLFRRFDKRMARVA